MPTITTKAKRQAIVKAYGCHRAEDYHPDDLMLMDDFYYSRRHLAKLPQANADGWHELRYRDEEADLRDAIELALRIIRQRDGVKYFKEVARNLIEHIESDVECHTILEKFQRAADRAES